MTMTYEAAVVLVEQLSPTDQARLVALLARRLQHALQIEAAITPADDPAFWQTPLDDSVLSDTLAAVPESSSAHTATQAVITSWFGAPLPEEDARDLAMSASIAEWNLNA